MLNVGNDEVKQKESPTTTYFFAFLVLAKNYICIYWNIKAPKLDLHTSSCWRKSDLKLFQDGKIKFLYKMKEKTFTFKFGWHFFVFIIYPLFGNISEVPFRGEWKVAPVSPHLVLMTTRNGCKMESSFPFFFLLFFKLFGRTNCVRFFTLVQTF